MHGGRIKVMNIKWDSPEGRAAGMAMLRNGIPEILQSAPEPQEQASELVRKAPTQNKEWFARVMDRRRAIQEIEECPPYTVEVETVCEDCDGTGRDRYSSNPFEFEPCDAQGCNDGKVKVMRQYLAEAFRIAAGEQITVEAGHLTALTAYARATVSALMAKEAA